MWHMNVTHVTPCITENMKTFLVMCAASLKDHWNVIVKKYTLTDYNDFGIILAEIQINFRLRSLR